MFSAVYPAYINPGTPWEDCYKAPTTAAFAILTLKLVRNSSRNSLNLQQMFKILIPLTCIFHCCQHLCCCCNNEAF